MEELVAHFVFGGFAWLLVNKHKQRQMAKELSCDLHSRDGAAKGFVTIGVQSKQHFRLCVALQGVSRGKYNLVARFRTHRAPWFRDAVVVTFEADEEPHFTRVFKDVRINAYDLLGCGMSLQKDQEGSVIMTGAVAKTSFGHWFPDSV